MANANSINQTTPPTGAWGTAYAKRMEHTGAARKEASAVQGDQSGSKEAQDTSAGWTEVEAKRNGRRHLKSEDGTRELWEADNNTVVHLEGDMMQIGMPDNNRIQFNTATGQAIGQTPDGTQFEVVADAASKSLSYKDAGGRIWTFEPIPMRVSVWDGNGVTRINSDGSVEAPQPQAQPQPQPQPQNGPPGGVINPALGVNPNGTGNPAAQNLYTQGIYAQRGDQNVMTPSGIIRTVSADGLNVLNLPGDLALCDGPAGAFVLDPNMGGQPITPVRTAFRRPDGSQEWMYQFQDSKQNVWTCFSNSLDVHVQSPQGVSQMILPQGNIFTVYRGQDGQVYTHERLPDGKVLQTGGANAQFAGDRVIMQNGGGGQPVVGLPFPVSGFLSPDFQQAYANQQAQDRARQAQQGAQQMRTQQATGPQVTPQGDPSLGANPGGGIPGTPDNPIPVGGAPQPQPAVTPGQGHPPTPVKPGLWQRIKDRFNGRQTQQGQWGPNGPQGPAGPWQPPPYAQYGPGPSGPPTPWNSQIMPPQQGNGWMTAMLGMSALSTVMTSVMMLSTVSMCSPWNMSFFSPFGLGFF
ncbi:MAG: hypothetical protein AB1758_23210 [Candidatus Eremiobacterota bacterium]